MFNALLAKAFGVEIRPHFLSPRISRTNESKSRGAHGYCNLPLAVALRRGARVSNPAVQVAHGGNGRAARASTARLRADSRRHVLPPARHSHLLCNLFRRRKRF